PRRPEQARPRHRRGVHRDGLRHRPRQPVLPSGRLETQRHHSLADAGSRDGDRGHALDRPGRKPAQHRIEAAGLPALVVVAVHYMPRKKRHEDHLNHEAWAIPYGDLVTLLLAFFVVMYAISSVNEGKYRVLSDSLFAAFRGSPRTLQPVQVGEKQVGSGADV